MNLLKLKLAGCECIFSALPDKDGFYQISNVCYEHEFGGYPCKEENDYYDRIEWIISELQAPILSLDDVGYPFVNPITLSDDKRTFTCNQCGNVNPNRKMWFLQHKELCLKR